MNKGVLFSSLLLVTAAGVTLKYTPAWAYTESLLNLGDEDGDVTIDPDTLMAGTTDVEGTIDLGEELEDLGYYIGECGNNGLYTSDFEDAVRWFQRNNGVTANGIADPHTQELIKNAAEDFRSQRESFGAVATRDRNVFSPSVISYSNTEKQTIRYYQVGLISLGYNISDCMANGEMDEQTVEALKQFQQDQEIYPVTGVLDLKTQKRIEYVLQDAGINMQEQEIYREIMFARSGEIEPSNAEVRRVAYTMRDETLRERRDYYTQRNRVPEYLADDIYEAALRTGWDIDYLFVTSSQESSNRPWARPDCSDCTTLGPFQFIQQTWLNSLKNNGAKYGYSNLADAIYKSGRYYRVKGDAAFKQYVLDMRKDTRLSALMAAELAHSNHQSLVASLGHGVGKTEVYLAHFFGSTDAVRFIKAYRENPEFNAAEKFPTAAEQNLKLFYVNGDTSRPRPASYIYDLFKRKITPDGNNVLSLGPRIDPDFIQRPTTNADSVRTPITSPPSSLRR